jgi:hypothetical protein
MLYTLYIKSHCEAPDLEREMEANSKEEAIGFFYEWLKNYGWDRTTISQNVIAEDEFNVGLKQVLQA